MPIRTKAAGGSMIEVTYEWKLHGSLFSLAASGTGELLRSLYKSDIVYFWSAQFPKMERPFVYYVGESASISERLSTEIGTILAGRWDMPRFSNFEMTPGLDEWLSFKREKNVNGGEPKSMWVRWNSVFSPNVENYHLLAASYISVLSVRVSDPQNPGLSGKASRLLGEALLNLWLCEGYWRSAGLDRFSTKLPSNCSPLGLISSHPPVGQSYMIVQKKHAHVPVPQLLSDFNGQFMVTGRRQLEKVESDSRFQTISA